MKSKLDFLNLGYLTIKNFYSTKDIEEMMVELENSSADSFQNKNLRLFPKNDYAIENKQLKYLKNPQILVPNLYRLLTTELFNLVETLIGENSFVTSIELHRKGKYGSITPPHQDNFYFCLSKGASLTAYIPLNKQGPFNGGLYVYPKSHLENFKHIKSSIVGFSSGIKEQDLKNYESVSYSVDQGDLTFHHCNIVHGAPVNTSSIPRLSIAIRFQGSNDIKCPEKLLEYNLFRDQSIREI